MFSGGYFEHRLVPCFGAIVFFGLFTPALPTIMSGPTIWFQVPGHAETKRAYFQDIAIGGAGNEWIPARPE
jgi:hypothetical protein